MLSCNTPVQTATREGKTADRTASVRPREDNVVDDLARVSLFGESAEGTPGTPVTLAEEGTGSTEGTEGMEGMEGMEGTEDTQVVEPRPKRQRTSRGAPPIVEGLQSLAPLIDNVPELRKGDLVAVKKPGDEWADFLFEVIGFSPRRNRLVELRQVAPTAGRGDEAAIEATMLTKVSGKEDNEQEGGSDEAEEKEPKDGKVSDEDKERPPQLNLVFTGFDSHCRRHRCGSMMILPPPRTVCTGSI